MICIIHTNLLGCTTTKCLGKTSLCLQKHALLNTTSYHSIHLALTSQRRCNVTLTFNLAYQPVGLEGKRKPELYTLSSMTVPLWRDSLNSVVGTTHGSVQNHLPPAEPPQIIDKTTGNERYRFCCRMLRIWSICLLEKHVITNATFMYQKSCLPHCSLSPRSWRHRYRWLLPQNIIHSWTHFWTSKVVYLDGFDSSN